MSPNNPERKLIAALLYISVTIGLVDVSEAATLTEARYSIVRRPGKKK
jgi:hypothetical protein